MPVESSEVVDRTPGEPAAAPLWRHYGSLDEAERRVLMLVNPVMQDPSATVNGLFAGIQILLPGAAAVRQQPARPTGARDVARRPALAEA